MSTPAVALQSLPALFAAFPFLSARSTLDWPAVNCPAPELPGLMKRLKEEWEYDLLMDVSPIDWHERSPRYEVVYHIYSLSKHVYLRVAAPCADDAEPTMPTLSTVWPGANWHEREAYDMFGIKFVGHPDLRRILMWDGYPYFPLRKDFPLAGLDAPLPAADVQASTGATVKPAPMMGGPFHAKPGTTLAGGEPRAADESWTELDEAAPRPAPTAPAS